MIQALKKLFRRANSNGTVSDSEWLVREREHYLEEQSQFDIEQRQQEEELARLRERVLRGH